MALQFPSTVVLLFQGKMMHKVLSRSRWQTLLSSLLLGSALFAATSPAVAVDAAQGAGAQGAAQANYQDRKSVV